MKPFGDYAADRLMGPYGGLRVHRDFVCEAATVYLFRFDRHLTTEFVEDTFATLARRFADMVGVSIPESRRVFLRSFHDSSRAYFAVDWDKVDEFCDANCAGLSRLRRKVASHLNIIKDEFSDHAAAQPVNGVLLDTLIENANPKAPLVVKVYADYCTKCTQIAPDFEAAARELAQFVLFVTINGPLNLDSIKMLKIREYPTILRFTSPSRNPEIFPRTHRFSAVNIAAFARAPVAAASADGASAFDMGDRPSPDAVLRRAASASVVPVSEQGAAVGSADPSFTMMLKRRHSLHIAGIHPTVDPHAASVAAHSAEHDPDPAGALIGQWAGMLRRQGIDELEALVRDRDAVIHSRIDKALRNASPVSEDGSGCGGSESDDSTGCAVDGSVANAMPCSADSNPARLSARSPTAILLGGGMGSGKTSVVNALSSTAFWQERGSAVVVVEADAFKQTDPMFTALSGIGVEKASKIVHAKSLEGADELLLMATRERRDVVFDGTMAWKPFVVQTIAMLRDGQHVYERGPGYSVDEATGEVSEIYWVRAGRREVAVAPYHVEVVGVSVDAPVAVERAIVRALVTGRSVPVQQQLESHRLFSAHFMAYAGLADAAYLFDMSSMTGEEVGKGGAEGSSSASRHRGIVACKSGRLFTESGRGIRNGALAVENVVAFSRFLRKQHINTGARRASEVYASENARDFVLGSSAVLGMNQVWPSS